MKTSVLNEQEQAIANAITSFVRSANSSGLTGPTPWTDGIYKTLADLGRSRGLKAACTPHGDEREWLYDVLWYKEVGTGLDLRLQSVPMVAESEWNLHGIGDDFEKLLVANAETRLFVCCPNEKYWDELRQYFDGSIQGFQQNRTGDRYMVAWIRHDSKDPHFDVFVKR